MSAPTGEIPATPREEFGKCECWQCSGTNPNCPVHGTFREAVNRLGNLHRLHDWTAHSKGCPLCAGAVQNLLKLYAAALQSSTLPFTQEDVTNVDLANRIEAAHTQTGVEMTPEVKRAVQNSRHRLTHWLIATTPEHLPPEYHADPRLFVHDVHVLIHDSNERTLDAMRQ